MDYICLIIGIIIIAAAVFCAYRKRHDTKLCISTITFGVLLSVFFMVLPTEWSKSDKALISPIYNLISALLYSFKVLGGRQDISQLDTIGFTGIVRYIYILINYAAFIATPILGSSLVLSFVGDSIAKIKYILSLSKKIYVFSELNENSYLIAKGLRENNKKAKLVFCSTKEVDRALVEEARKLHAIDLYKKCEDIRIKRNAEKYDFYLVFENEDKNTELARKLVEKHAEIKDKYISIIAFAKSGPETELLENIVQKLMPKPEKKPEEKEETEVKNNPVENENPEKNNNNRKADNKKSDWKMPNINITFINKTELFCNNIVYENPLYDMADEDQNISVMIIGCGETGMCMLKTVLWSGQIYGHKLKVRVYDKDKEKCRTAFEKSCPELNIAHGYDVEFIKADVLSKEFEAEITKNGQAKSATVAYIFTGDDEFNINAAVSLHGIFRKNRGFGKTAPIFTWMNGSEKFSNFSNKESDYLTTRNIILTGNIENVFSDKMIFQTKLERMALATHFCYNGVLGKDKNSTDYKKACVEFINKDYNRRSSMAAAIHFNTKLYIFDLWMKEHVKSYCSADLKKHFEEQMENAKTGEATEIARILAQNEHDRWNTFMRSEGYCTANIEAMKIFAPKTKKDRDDFSKLHACITDWDSLDEVERVFNSLGNDKNFKGYDFLICRKIFEIESFAEKLKEEKLMYTPNPTNTENVTLPKELLELTEKIAENVHDVWAKGRIKEGWTYGEKRDDLKKETPCLVPYDELPESEKEYDRNTAMETVKLILSLGYKIKK